MRGGIRLAAITGAALLVVACGSDAVGETLDEPLTLIPLVEERALWNATGADAVSTVTDATLRGDTAVIVGEQKDGYRLATVDAATGAPRWSIGERDPLPGGDGVVLFRPTITDPALLVAGPPEDFLVFVPYYRDACAHPSGWCPRENGVQPRAEQGVAALSGKDGSVRWMTPVISGEENQDMRLKLLAASDDLLLAGSVGFDDSPSSLSTLALSTSDGHELWQQGGMEAYFITERTVIGHMPTNRNEILGVGRGLSEGTVVAVDALTGDRRWDLSQRFTSSDTWVAAGDVAVVQTKSGETDNALILEADTGREMARIGDYADNCASDSSSLIACVESPTTGNRLITFDLDERRIRISRDEIGSRRIRAVWDGRVFLEDDWFPDGRYSVVDRSANVLPEPMPGQIMTISDRYAIFRSGEDSDISVHAVKV
jgi:outer membrane protein assembly factor BamB